jgi:hypothetical protein
MSQQRQLLEVRVAVRRRASASALVAVVDGNARRACQLV